MKPGIVPSIAITRRKRSAGGGGPTGAGIFGNASGYYAAVLADTPLTYWALHNNALDYSGNARDLTTNGVPSFSSGATNFSSSNYFSIAGAAAVSPPLPFSFEACFTTPASLASLVGFFGNGTNGVHMFTLGGTGQMRVTHSGVVITSSALSVSTNYHLLYTNDNVTPHVYLNGADLGGSNPAFTQDLANPFTIGNAIGFGAATADTKISDVAIYGTALSAGRAAAHYAARAA